MIYFLFIVMGTQNQQKKLNELVSQLEKQINSIDITKLTIIESKNLSNTFKYISDIQLNIEKNNKLVMENELAQGKLININEYQEQIETVIKIFSATLNNTFVNIAPSLLVGKDKHQITNLNKQFVLECLDNLSSLKPVKADTSPKKAMGRPKLIK